MFLSPPLKEEKETGTIPAPLIPGTLLESICEFSHTNLTIQELS